jgi:hypothetical protein
MPPARALVLTALLSSVLWVGIGAAGAVVSYFGLGPSGVATLLLPQTLPRTVWFAPPPQLVLGAAIGGAVHAGAVALLLPAVTRRARRVVPIWFASVLAGVLATAVVATAFALPDLAVLGRASVLGAVAQQVAPAALWGVVWGWLPAVIGSRLGDAAPARVSGWLPAALVLVAAGAAAVLVLPGVATATRAEPEPPVAAVPSPTPTHIGWAQIDPPSPTPEPGACGSEDVTVTLGAEDAATGHRTLPLRVTNTGSAACSVEGYPDVVFDDVEGDAMDVLVVRGGSFMTTDDGPARIRLTPGASAQADLGWNAQSAAGEQRAGRVLVSVRPGEARLPADVDLDVKDGGSVALTAWKRVAG